MAKNIFNISTALLIIVLAIHLFNAWVWGNWDPDGTGSYGFWSFFIESAVYYVWPYSILLTVFVVSWIFRRRFDGKND